MTSTNPPLFSDFQAIRLSNPSLYWSAKTQSKMAQAYQHHGKANFFDLYEAGQ